jgi:hypothetical protein
MIGDDALGLQRAGEAAQCYGCGNRHLKDSRMMHDDTDVRWPGLDDEPRRGDARDWREHAFSPTALSCKSAKTSAPANSRKFTSGGALRPILPRRPARFFTILSSNNAASPLSERRNDMKTEDELQLRREVRDSVFRAERMHRAGRPVEADEQLAGELAAAQARLAELGCPDPAATLLHWRADDEAAYALAELVADLVTERSRRQAAPPAAAASPASTPHSGDSATPQYAFPAPPTDVPALADLLDDMLSRESRARS